MLAEESVAVFHYLVAPANQVEVVALEELLELLAAENPATASLVLLPVSDVFIRVVPYQVSHQPRVRDICGLGNLLDLLETMHVLGEAAVHAHDLFINKGHKGHVVEAIIKLLPQRNLVPSLNLIEEPIDPSDCLALVVAPKNDDL